MAIRVLALDGGGVRGALSGQLLHRLEEQEPFLADVAVFAGTSTGAILAGGLACGMTPQELVDLYANHSEAIFSPGWMDCLGPAARRRDAP
jgi:patatin-like phospholipase/acyl hydrolase